ncbi:MAG: YidC/Oxa1 family membrane protein insertase [Symbiobacteriaceae bacterium]|nr:YidC/Oxa1 family membrane protein insertase [Symbiobacteriaceae bacterium]
MNPFTMIYQFIVDAFRFALDAFYGITGNYAMAIVLLTVLFNLLFTPMRIRTMRNTLMMRLLQPKIDSINKKYKDDKDRINKETMELWNKYNFNPLSGCAPSLLQFPLFIAILSVFRDINFPEGAASAFLWIPYIGEPESAFLGIAFGSLELKILPLLAGLASYIQTKFMGMSPTDKNSQMMMTMMPLMMIWICWSQPASLSIYWTTSQFVYALQQIIIQRLVKVEILPEDMIHEVGSK